MGLLNPDSDPLVSLSEQMKTLVEMENSGLVTLLRDDKFDDLARMYSLLRRVDGGSLLIRTVMNDHVKEVGKQLVQDPDKCKVGGAEEVLLAMEYWLCQAGAAECSPFVHTSHPPPCL